MIGLTIIGDINMPGRKTQDGVLQALQSSDSVRYEILRAAAVCENVSLRAQPLLVPIVVTFSRVSRQTMTKHILWHLLCHTTSLQVEHLNVVYDHKTIRSYCGFIKYETAINIGNTYIMFAMVYFNKQTYNLNTMMCAQNIIQYSACIERHK